MPANYFAIPFVLLTLLFLYLGWEVDDTYSKWMIVPLVATAIVYVSAPQINWWWWKRYPPQLEPALRQLLERFDVFYQQLGPAEQARFGTRLFLFRNAVDWQPIAWPEEELPVDVQVAISAQAVMLTFGQEKFLFDDFEKVVVYPKPFVSPTYPFGHASELYQPDGCLIFSAEQVMLAFTQPQRMYNVALHEYAKVYMLSKQAGQTKWPHFDNEPLTWAKLERVSAMSQEYIETVIAIEGVEPSPVAVHHFFIFPERFKEVFPREYDAYKVILGQ